MKFGIGQSATRKEDQRFLTGTGRYTDDINIEGQAYAYILRSPHAHAEIERIDTRAAIQAPGVLCVLTGADAVSDGLGNLPPVAERLIENRDGSDIYAPPYPILATDRVRHVGNAVALVVANTLDQARDGAELIDVTFTPLPAVTNAVTAISDDAVRIWDGAPNNICLDWEEGDQAVTEKAFARASHIVAVDLINNRLVVNAMETRAALGVYDAAEDAFTLHATTQGTHIIQRLLGEAVFSVPPEKFRVITPDVGGGFGGKVFFYMEYPAILWASRKIGRPVKWTGDRSQGFVGDAQARDHFTHAELALDDEGRILGLRADITANLGAYLSSFAAVMPTKVGEGLRSGAYRIPAGHVAVKGVFTNTVPVDAYRGVGAAEAIYLIERLIEEAARECNVDPDELRRRNLVPADAMPYTNAFGLTLDSGDFLRNMMEAQDLADWGGFATRREAARQRGKSRGIGMACYLEASGGPNIGPEYASVRIEEDETITVWVGGQSSGQGHETAFAQMVADELGIPFERIKVRQGDTAELAQSGITGDSRMAVIGGMAVNHAAKDVIDKGKAAASDLLEVAAGDLHYAEGEYVVVGTDRNVSLFDVAAAFRTKTGDARLEGAGEWLPDVPTFPNGCHICEVEIDPETGALDIVAYTVVDDFGRVVNPMILAGQVHGGIAQGLGQALMEGAVYEEGSGQLLTGSFMDYGLPRADLFPTITSKWNEIPCPSNPLGIKGAGEAGTVGATPALINAILNALSELGVTHIDMPATPERLWQAIHGQDT